MAARKTKPIRKSTRKKKAVRKKGFSVEEWAKKTQPNIRGNKCKTCEATEVREAVHVVLELMVNKKSFVSMPQIHKMLVEHFDYDLTASALKKHIRQCEKETWSKVDKAR